jgi:hypothetical protein
MRSTIFWACVILTLAAVLAGQPALATSDGNGTWKWEYRVLNKGEIAVLAGNSVAAGLNKLGEEGWELVAVEPGYTAPPGAGGGTAAQFYFKRPKDLPLVQREATARRVAAAEADVAMWKDRASYSERMYKKGFISENQTKADRDQLRQAEAYLDAAKRELESYPPPPKSAAPKERVPEPK